MRVQRCNRASIFVIECRIARMCTVGHSMVWNRWSVHGWTLDNANGDRMWAQHGVQCIVT